MWETFPLHHSSAVSVEFTSGTFRRVSPVNRVYIEQLDFSLRASELRCEPSKAARKAGVRLRAGSKPRAGGSPERPGNWRILGADGNWQGHPYEGWGSGETPSRRGGGGMMRRTGTGWDQDPLASFKYTRIHPRSPSGAMLTGEGDIQVVEKWRAHLQS